MCWGSIWRGGRRGICRCSQLGIVRVGFWFGNAVGESRRLLGCQTFFLNMFNILFKYSNYSLSHPFKGLGEKNHGLDWPV